MARPPNARADLTRARIVEAASRIFARKGLAGASVREIAAEAGLSLGLIRHYFGGKAGLYQACIDIVYLRLGGLVPAVAAAVEGGASLDEALAAAVRRSFRALVSDRASIQLVLLDLLGDEPGRTQSRSYPRLAEFVSAAAEYLSPRLERPASELLLPLRSLALLISRYALVDAEELATLTDVDTADPEACERQALERLEQHLVEVALLLLRGSGVGA